MTHGCVGKSLLAWVVCIALTGPLSAGHSDTFTLGFQDTSYTFELLAGDLKCQALHHPDALQMQVSLLRYRINQREEGHSQCDNVNELDYKGEA